MSGPTLDNLFLSRVVSAALDEDLGPAGDLTTDALIRDELQAAARLVARQDLTVAGLPVARETFGQLSAAVEMEAHAGEGGEVDRGTTIARVRGPVGALLRGERTALNFMMRMSGIATATRSAVNEIVGTGARIRDTRKTAPGLRLLDKYAVAAGGGQNHRRGLYDAAMVKDTHLAVSGTIRDAVAKLRERGLPPAKVTVEVRSVAQLEQAIVAGAGRALLDNMGPEQLRDCVRVGKGKIVLEASGGLRPGRLRAVAETGVDFLSLGWLTHSAPSADIAMEMEESR